MSGGEMGPYQTNEVSEQEGALQPLRGA